MDSGRATFSGYSFSDKRKCLLNSEGHEVKLRPKSLSVFQYLSERPDTVVSKQDIVDAVWQDVVVTDDSLTKCISEIRRALGDDNYTILQTVPRQGYMLVPDTAALPENSSTSTITAGAPLLKRLDRLNKPYRLLLLVPLFAIAAIALNNDRDTAFEPAAIEPLVTVTSTDALKQDTAGIVVARASSSDQNQPDRYMPSLSVSLENETSSRESEWYAVFHNEIRVALSHYKTIRLVDAENTDYIVKPNVHATDNDNINVYIELVHTGSQAVLFGHGFTTQETGGTVSDSAATVAIRAAGMIASPGGGAIGRHLLQLSRHKPADELTRAECIAHAYDCTNCSGELDSITPKAEACVARLLSEDPGDAHAWALQGTIYAHQYTFGSTLPEPQRTHLKARAHLPDAAIRAATRAEQLSNGGNSVVYWGLAQAYSASCQTDKLRSAVQRGLEINPDDPGLLAAFGNWIAYTGHWDEGAQLVERALEIEPRFYKKWWLFGPAKRHYSRGEYQQAYDLFARAFNERNWLSHLQFAYTLPYLDRLDEARQAVQTLQDIAPGITMERILQFYRTYCFSDTFLADIKKALTMAGMPSRGNSDNLDAIKVPHAKILSIGDYQVEYLDLGEGTPVVFVHGSISDYRTWAHYQNPISESFRYISYSRRYYGSQPWPDDEGENHSHVVAAQDLIAFVEQLQLPRAVLVSWSSGGPIANLAAAARPGLFTGMVHYEPVDNDVFSEEESLRLAATRDALYGGFNRVDALLEKKDYANSVKAFLEVVFELEQGDFENEIMPLRRVILDSAKSETLRRKPSTPNTCEFLSRIKIPTVIVRGANTNRFWSDMSAKFAECMPNAELVTLPGVNHDGPIRDHQAFFGVIEKFIRNHH